MLAGKKMKAIVAFFLTLLTTTSAILHLQLRDSKTRNYRKAAASCTFMLCSDSRSARPPMQEYRTDRSLETKL